jgi:hypothetical protein
MYPWLSAFRHLISRSFSKTVQRKVGLMALRETTSNPVLDREEESYETQQEHQMVAEDENEEREFLGLEGSVLQSNDKHRFNRK